jgi:hypothetical protein
MIGREKAQKAQKGEVELQTGNSFRAAGPASCRGWLFFHFGFASCVLFRGNSSSSTLLCGFLDGGGDVEEASGHELLLGVVEVLAVHEGDGALAGRFNSHGRKKITPPGPFGVSDGD